jgi:DNA-binding response OmpR family regulator
MTISFAQRKMDRVTSKSVNRKKSNMVQPKFTILLVDDEIRILHFLKTKLTLSGYNVMLANSGIEALTQFQEREPDLVVLDVLMPKMDGFQTLKELRIISSVPVIMLSAMGDDLNKIRGLGLGADDYLPKPFNPDELVARIEAIKRRTSLIKSEKPTKDFVLHDLNINFDEHRILVHDKEVKLTRIEWLLLHEMAANAGHLLLYYDLLSRIWGPEYRNDVQILRTWVSRLRQKIEDNPDTPKYIKTVPKTGYIFSAH